MIICFNQSVITQARKLIPQYNANWLTGYKQDTKEAAWKPTPEDVLATLKRTGATGLGTDRNLEVIDQAFVDAIRDAGFPFHVWTVNDVESARKFAGLGAISITTDRPEFIRNAILLQTAKSH